MIPAEVLHFQEPFELFSSRKKLVTRGRGKGELQETVRGYYVRARIPQDPSKVRELALDATLRAAAIRRSVKGFGRWGPPPYPTPLPIEASLPIDAVHTESRPVTSMRMEEALTGGNSMDKMAQGKGRSLVELQDLREKVRVGWGNRLVVFLVDSSDSMDVSQQLAAAKGAVVLLLSRAYVRRDRVSLIAFQGERAKVILSPTTSVHLARKKLACLIPGGATPLSDGLLTSWKLIRSERIKNPKRRIILVILSDGEGNVPLVPGADQEKELAALARLIRKERIHVVWVDTSPEGKETKLPTQLAATLGAEWKKLKRVGSFDLVSIVERDRK